MSDDNHVAPIPLFKAATLEDRIIALEAHQLATGAAFSKSFTTIHEAWAQSDAHLHWCITHVHTLHAVVWMLAVLNIVLLAILAWREFVR